MEVGARRATERRHDRGHGGARRDVPRNDGDGEGLRRSARRCTARASCSTRSWRPSPRRTTRGTTRPDELRDNGLRHLRAAVALLESKATAEEVDEYRRFVLAVANKVAAAHREHGQSVSPERGRRHRPDRGGARHVRRLTRVSRHRSWKARRPPSPTTPPDATLTGRQPAESIVIENSTRRFHSQYSIMHISIRWSTTIRSTPGPRASDRQPDVAPDPPRHAEREVAVGRCGRASTARTRRGS